MEKRVDKRARAPLLASTMLLGIGVALAAHGDLDPTFSGDGLLSLTDGNSQAGAAAVIQQADGKLVLAGWGGLGVMVARVDEDGTPDRTFGTDGVASADISSCCQSARTVIQQMDGKLVLAGGGPDIALARFNANGTLDASFGSGGKVSLDIAGNDDGAAGLIQQPDGKFVVAGYTISGGNSRIVLARFNSDGMLDTTFGTGGTTLIDFGGEFASLAADIGQQSDGKLVAVGRVIAVSPTGAWLSSDIGIVRVTANGMLDSTFDGDGLVTIDFNGGDEVAATVAIQSDDAIVVTGATSSGELLLRVNGDGSLDNSFIVSLGVLPDTNLRSIVWQADGKLVATGSRSTDAGGEDMILARFNSDGLLDTSYGIDGVATADFGERDSAPNSWGVELIQQASGKYVAVGTSGSDSYSFAAARFDDNAAFPGRIGLTETRQSVDETSGTISYTVRRTGGKTGAVTVEFATSAGTAQPGSDFEAEVGTLSWDDGDVSNKTITIDLIDDVDSESMEDFTLSLSNPSGNAQLAASIASTQIESEDGPGEVYFQSRDYRVFEHFAGTRIGISLAVVRANGSNGAVGVSYRTVNGTAIGGQDFEAVAGTLTWADGETGTKQISSSTCPDTIVEGDETFQVQLSDPTGGATIRPSRAIQNVLITNFNGSIEHHDCLSDSGGGQFELELTKLLVNESKSAQVNVFRNGNTTGVVSVTLTPIGRTATAGDDFAPEPVTVSWVNGDAGVRSVEFAIRNDADQEASESFTVELSNPTGGAVVGPQSSVTITIADNDQPRGGGGGTTSFELLALLGLLKLFVPRVRQIRRRETRPGVL